MAKMNLVAVVIGLSTICVVVALDPFAVVNVLVPQVKTIPPTKGEQVKYVETVYKATDHQTMVHTVQPLQPSYEVSYLSTELSTIMNQTISTSTMELSTILNTTVEYNTEMLANYTYNGAATYYQTLDFQSQEISYTPVTGTEKTLVTVTETNALPFV